MAFEVSGMDMTTMTYEPLAIPSQYTEISDTQAWSIYRKFEVWPKILLRYEWGWYLGRVNVQETMPACSADEVYHVYSTRYVPNR